MHNEWGRRMFSEGKIKIKKRMTLSAKSLYFFSFALWFVLEFMLKTSLYADSDLKNIDKVINIFLLMSLMVILVYFQKYNFTNSILIAVVSIIVLIVSLRSGEFSYICLWLFIIAANNISFTKVVELTYILLTVLIISVVLLCFLGVFEDFVLFRNGQMRHSLGFAHPNTLGERIFQWLICRVYLRWKKIDIKDIVVMLLSLAVVFYVANSQTATICILLLIVFILIYLLLIRHFKTAKSAFWIFVFSLSILFPVVSIYLAIAGIKNTFFFELDYALSHRFLFANKVYLLYGSTLLGQNIYIPGGFGELKGLSERLWLDNAYAYIWLKLGSVFLILFIYIYWETLYRFRKYCYITLVLFLYALYGLMEQSLVQLTHNIFLLLFAWSIYSNKDCSEFDVFLD